MKTSRHKYNNLHNVMVDAMRRAEPLRTFLVLSLLLLLVGSMSAQSAGWNYVMTVCPLEGSVSEPSTDADMSRVTIEYLDDLGRKISTVNVGASYAVQDMADYITYDGRGRVSRRYLPFETPSSTGSFPQSAVSTAQAYHGDLYCFSETTYDGTADSRVASVTGPGQAWHATGKSVKTRHLFNNATGEGPHACVIFQAQGDSLDIYLTYRADGVKRLEQTRRRYIKVITRVDGEGNVTTVNRPMTENHVRRYYGSMVTETGRDRRIYNEVGYIDVHNNGDSVSYHYYERDYLGSVRLVVNECGDIEQATDYCVGGLPSTRLATGNVDRRHHTSKEMLTFHGVSLYDNQARWYDPILCRFTTPDPLAEQYPDLSPYSHCANNPLTIVDPSGMLIRNYDTKDVFYQKYKDATPVEFYNGNGYETEFVLVEIGLIYTSKGRAIAVFKNASGIPIWDDNCHWYSFGRNDNGEFVGQSYWIAEDVTKIIEDDYSKVDINNAQPGDVIVFSGSSEGEKNHHSMVIDFIEAYDSKNPKTLEERINVIGNNGPQKGIKNTLSLEKRDDTYKIYRKTEEDVYY
ncbi:MAG: hypothetical protein IJC40_05470 [Muribaculaceae bacterium]|nr:hypothetical protein [Muribaculaceae bacterium]